MSNTTQLSEAEATPAARLIIKAILSWQNLPQDTRTSRIISESRLRAFGEVAADVLDMCPTPDKFSLIIREVSASSPHPYVLTITREKAVTMRETWQRSVTADVLDRLSNNDGRPSDNSPEEK